MGKSGKKTKRKKENRFGIVLSGIGNLLIWVVLLVYFIGLPLYFRNGYELLATNKYKFFMYTSKYVVIILLTYVFVYFSLWGMTKDEIKVYKPIYKIDVSMLAFIVLLCISYWASPYKSVGEKGDFFFYEGALYGTSGWYMGFMTFLILAVLYFIISRFFKYTNKIWIPIFIVSSCICVWGALNRYSVYPVYMEYQSNALIASLGNINWFAGFQSVITPLIMGIYWGTEKKYSKCFLGIALWISFLMILLNGSDSGIFAFAVTLFVLFVVSLKNTVRLQRFAEIFLIFAGSVIFEFVADICFPGKRNYSGILSEILVTGIIPFIILIVATCLLVLSIMIKREKIRYSEFMKNKLGKILVILALATLVIIIMLIFVNTKTNGALPIIGSSSFFIFDGRWGSSRGATWTSGLLNFKGMSFIRKLIGSGPDTFYFQLKSNETAYEYAYSFFNNSRLTNAHNEIITLLVNIGILGTVAFITVSVVTFIETFKISKKEPCAIAFSLTVVMYFANNMFSFEQISSTPLYFLVLAVSAAAIVEYNKAKNL